MHPARRAYVEDEDPIVSLEKARFAKTIAVPTDDTRVRARLRELKEPQTLFGEGPGDRRDRLRGFLADIAAQSDDHDTPMQDADEQEQDEEPDEEFFTAGIPELLAARKEIARYTLPKARERIAQQRLEAGIPLRTHVKFRNPIKEKLSGFDLYSSQVAAERPIGVARFSPSGELIATGHWGGGIKLLSVPNLETTQTFRGHNGIVSGMAWYPGATLPSSITSPSEVNLASGGGMPEGDIQLWNLVDDEPLATMSGHTGRVSHVEFHPSGRFLASASHDTTWRLWDVASTTELLLQEGHSREVHTVAFNPDGSLLASGGHDGIGRIWDLRTGRTIMILDSHIGKLHALDWSPDSYRILTGASDGFAKCWDVRSVRETASIGANNGGVTDLKWFKGQGMKAADVEMADGGAINGSITGNDVEKVAELLPKKSGTFFVSCGFDKNVKVFSADDWALCKSLSGHAGNVLSVDITDDARFIASSGYDRTVKLWARDDGQGI
jgi:U4/U6 small nuclear ribonucleoprotein PRP4